MEQAGFTRTTTTTVNDPPRFVPLTPPGAACSIVPGTGITQMPPGSQAGL